VYVGWAGFVASIGGDLTKSKGLEMNFHGRFQPRIVIRRDAYIEFIR
jgi:hypothetical protein